MNIDPVDTILDAHLDYLETGGPEPSLEDLTHEDQQRARELVALLHEARGIGRRSRPSLDALLAGTEFEAWLEEAGDAVDPDLIDAIRVEVVGTFGLAATPRPDLEGQQERLRSHAVTVVAGVRLRLQYRAASDARTLRQEDPQRAAGAIFGRFPETAGVILVANDTHLSSVAISPFDIDHFISTPDGARHRPAIPRPTLPLIDTIKRYLEEVAPDLTAMGHLPTPMAVDQTQIIESEVAKVVQSIVTEGGNARTPAKKTVFTAFAQHSDDVTRLILNVVEGDLTPGELEGRIDHLIGSAA